MTIEIDPALIAIVEQFYPGVDINVVLEDQVAVNRILLESLVGLAKALAILSERVNRAAELTDLFEQFAGSMGLSGAKPKMPAGMPLLGKS